MKRFYFCCCLLTFVALTSSIQARLSTSEVRNEARFLTDKMAYELRLTSGQCDDVYEINYDFIYNVRDLLDRMVRSDRRALERYRVSLDYRNEDLSYVLNKQQYVRFLRMDYFNEPIVVNRSRWHFCVHVRYVNNRHFYYDRPHHYDSYRGAHNRHSHRDRSYYCDRYNHNSGFSHRPSSQMRPTPRGEQDTYRNDRESNRRQDYKHGGRDTRREQSNVRVDKDKKKEDKEQNGRIWRGN